MGEPFFTARSLLLQAKREADARWPSEEPEPKIRESVDSEGGQVSAKRLGMTACATYALLGDLIATVGLGAIDRAELYRHPRVEDLFLVAVEGRRLEFRRPVLARVIGVCAVMYLAARVITPVLGIGV